MANKKPMKAKLSAKAAKKRFLSRTIEHIDITKMPGIVPVVDAMQHMAYSARDLNRAAEIYDRMLRDKECGIILCLAGSLISAGLKKIIVDMIRNNMVDALVSTGANMVDQDFFEALGFKHYIAPDDFKSGMRDGELREMAIDRIYDTFIDEEDLRICDEATQRIFDGLEPGQYSSRQLLEEFGRYLDENDGPKCVDSIIYEAFKKDVPIFCPAFSDCSAGFGLVHHLHSRQGEPYVSWDGGKDFYELTQLKIKNSESEASLPHFNKVFPWKLFYQTGHFQFEKLGDQFGRGDILQRFNQIVQMRAGIYLQFCQQFTRNVTLAIG